MPVSLSAGPVPTPSRVTPLMLIAAVTATNSPDLNDAWDGVWPVGANLVKQVGDSVPFDVINVVGFAVAVAPAFAPRNVPPFEAGLETSRQAISSSVTPCASNKASLAVESLSLSEVRRELFRSLAIARKHSRGRRLGAAAATLLQLRQLGGQLNHN